MYKVTEISIDGFWQTFVAKSSFRDDVNIIIGQNGSGKTTFMNILQAVLSVDTDALYENSFSSTTIKLTDGKKKKTIRARKIEDTKSPFPTIEYLISNRKFSAPLVLAEESRVLPHMRRIALEETQKIKQELSQIVSVASLSVYRMIDGDMDARERMPRRSMSPVDLRLSNLTQRLTRYQLELSMRARTISSELQRDVLTSLLYKEEKTRRGRSYQLGAFNENTEKQKLTAAYRQLGLSGTDISKRISDHVAAIANAFSKLQQGIYTKEDGSPLDLAALDAYQLTSKVVEKSLSAEEKVEAISSQINLFLEKLKGFIPDKTFTLFGGDLKVKGTGPILINKLSSGEKQLLILFIEALLQQQAPCIFLADEPELSLHISWQRNIISAVRALNPNAQIIVATHSPEIAGKFRDCIIDMADILHV